MKEVSDDNHVSVDGFKLLRGDRTLTESGKKSGGGICVYINEKYCHPNNSSVKKHMCTPNVEILTVSIRPYYLPREFSHVILLTVYIPPSSLAAAAIEELCNEVQNVEASAPNSFICINGDFNHCSLKKSSVKFFQHVTCHTRERATLDLCYSNVKDAYCSLPLDKLGDSDHNLVALLPKYRPLVQRVKPRKLTVKQWSQESVGKLQGSLACTDWNVFTENVTDENELVETITDYINFCTEICIPTKTIKIFPNNKPWISKNCKDIINQKKRIFSNKSSDYEKKTVKGNLKQILKTDRLNYKRKIEKKFTENDMKSVWQGMKLMSGYSNGSKKHCQLLDSSTEYANELNVFYNRFDKSNFPTEAVNLRSFLCDDSVLNLRTNENEVRHLFRKQKSSKVAGPDMLHPCIFKLCSSELSFIFTYIFNCILSTQNIPNLWKKSCIKPVPKKPVITCMNDLRPIALTAIPMKVLERIILNYLKSLVAPFSDSCQFAYKANRSTEDAIIFVLEKLYNFLEKSKFGNSARVMFFDFSSAFNTIQPHVLVQKLLQMNVPKKLILLIYNYLTDRSQYVFLNEDIQSDSILSNTGVPQGTVLAPFLFTMYTDDFKSDHKSCPLIKFADDTMMVGLIENRNNSEYLYEINSFVNFCNNNFLELNVNKTKEMLIDFRCNSDVPPPVIINDTEIQRVNTYKYLGVIFDDKLKFGFHVDHIVKRLNSRLYCLYKLNLFGVQKKILNLFYQSIILSTWSYCIAGWGGNVSQKDKNRIDSKVRKCNRVIGVDQCMVDLVYNARVASRYGCVMGDVSHPLHSVLVGCLNKTGRMRLPCAETNRHHNSFLPHAIKYHNSIFRR